MRGIMNHWIILLPQIQKDISEMNKDINRIAGVLERIADILGAASKNNQYGDFLTDLTNLIRHVGKDNFDPPDAVVAPCDGVTEQPNSVPESDIQDAVSKNAGCWWPDSVKCRNFGCDFLLEFDSEPDGYIIECPKCHKRARKIISVCSFILKGGGWAVDGYSSAKK